MIYVLDGETQFQTVAAVGERLGYIRSVPEAIVVAVHNTNRVRDSTPTHIELGYYLNRETAMASGGSENFIRFLQQELIPRIESLYPTTSPVYQLREPAIQVMGWHPPGEPKAGHLLVEKRLLALHLPFTDPGSATATTVFLNEGHGPVSATRLPGINSASCLCWFYPLDLSELEHALVVGGHRGWYLAGGATG